MCWSTAGAPPAACILRPGRRTTSGDLGAGHAGRQHRPGHHRHALRAAALPPDRRDGLETVVGYLARHRKFLHHNRALEAGWPIATGVVEGTARHLIGDRLEITGARWGLAGAEAVLRLRAVISNGDLDAYWTFHLECEPRRRHQARHQDSYALTI